LVERSEEEVRLKEEPRKGKFRPLGPDRPQVSAIANVTVVS
jgi:hypothetical protein